MASLSILFLKTASCFLRNKRATLERNECMVCTFRIQKFWAQNISKKDKQNWWHFQRPNSYHHDHLGNRCLTNSATPAMSLAKKKGPWQMDKKPSEVVLKTLACLRDGIWWDSLPRSFSSTFSWWLLQDRVIDQNPPQGSFSFERSNHLKHIT